MSDADWEQRLTATGRNDQCPCGSGKKYKKCHLAEDELARTAALKALADEAAARAAAKAEEEGDEEGEGSDSKTSTKTKQTAKRGKGQAASKGKAGGGKPKNIPRRGAV
jgi:hypothetical protein